MKIVCDIGGTFARFGKAEGGTISDIQKFEAAQFESLEEALTAYGASAPQVLRIATAAYPDAGGKWRFVNQNKWVIDPDAMRSAGWDVELILNDFEAATWSLPHYEDHDLKTFTPGLSVGEGSLCLLGPGTGLGLGYYRDGRMQKTHGGHMPIASLNDEHGQVIKKIRSTQDLDVVFEDIVSGPGYFKLKELYDEETALRLFHEFLGVFAASVAVSGHAYGGVYLTGGVLEHLIDAGEFSAQTFLKSFHFNAVQSVKDALENTPVFYIKDPYPALRGLLYA